MKRWYEVVCKRHGRVTVSPPKTRKRRVAGCPLCKKEKRAMP